MTSHDSSSMMPPPTPPHRPARPRLSRGISSRRPQPPPVPPSLRDHPLLDVVANGGSSSTSASGSSTSSSTSNTPIASSRRSHSRRSSLSASPLFVPTDKTSMSLPSPTGLWTLPPRPSPPLGGPWTTPIGSDQEPVRDAMGLLDTVPAGSNVSAASPNGYPWHIQAQRRAQGYDYVSVQHHTPGYTLYPPAAGTPSRRPGSHPHSHSQPALHGHAHTQIPTSPSRQRHNHPVGTLHTHSPQPSPPITPAAA